MSFTEYVFSLQQQNVNLIYMYIVKEVSSSLTKLMHSLPHFTYENIQVFHLSKFQLYNTVLSTIVTTLYIRYSEYIHVATEKFYPFNPI